MQKRRIFNILLAFSLLATMLGTSSCGNDSSENSSEKHIHSWGEGEMLEEGSCEEHGRVKYTCTCGETRIEIDPAFGHDFPMSGTLSKTPTCTEDGVEIFTCRVCQESIEKKLTATGHDYVLGESSNGYRSAICKHCDDECLGEKQYELEGELPLMGLWEVMDGIYYGIWNLEHAPTYTLTDEVVHTAGKNAVKVDYANARLEAGVIGASALQIGIYKPVENAKYRLTFYVKASTDYNAGTVHFKANNNYFEGDSCLAVTPSLMNSNTLAGADWQQITIEFTANPKEDYSSLRLETWMEQEFTGQIYYADFSLALVPQEEI